MTPRLLILLIFCSQIAFAQNLIPNPSFEDINVCQHYNEECCPKAWRSSTLKMYGFHYYAPYRTDGIGAAVGGRFISLLLYDGARDFDRKFVQTALLCPLEAGKVYQLSLHYRIKDFKVDTFGVYFADAISVNTKNDRLEGIKPQIAIPFSDSLKLGEWYRFTGTYTATGREQGIILGNFQPDAETTVYGLPPAKKVKKGHKTPTYAVQYFFDAISLTPVETTGITCDLAANKKYIYLDSIRHFIRPIAIWPPENKTVSEVADLEKSEPSPSPTTATSKQPTFALDKTEIAINQTFTLESVLFKSNSAELLPSSYTSLNELRQILTNNRVYRLKVTGHTDNTGSTAYNLRLSTQRAQAIADYLMLEGIAPSRLLASGKGEMQPVADNKTAEGKAKNRRVEFELYE